MQTSALNTIHLGLVAAPFLPLLSYVGSPLLLKVLSTPEMDQERPWLSLYIPPQLCPPHVAAAWSRAHVPMRLAAPPSCLNHCGLSRTHLAGVQWRLSSQPGLLPASCSPSPAVQDLGPQTRGSASPESQTVLPAAPSARGSVRPHGSMSASVPSPMASLQMSKPVLPEAVLGGKCRPLIAKGQGPHSRFTKGEIQMKTHPASKKLIIK